MSSTQGDHVLSQGVGYGIVIGLGLAFSMIMVLITYIQKRYTSFDPNKTEEFLSAEKSIKPGLIAVGIVSAWTWAATLLQSSAVGFRFGIAGPYAYAAGATVQILLFAILASNLKMKAPNAHTFLEIIGERWGTGAHLVFLFFGFLANVIVSTMLVLGGVNFVCLSMACLHDAYSFSCSQSATVNDLTGMPTQAAVFLIPILVSFYVVVGGMRATLFADWSHTAALFILIWLFTLTVYVTSDQIGSPHKMYELLTAAAVTNPVEHNKDGSYLTFRSESALIFGVLNLVGNCGTVFLDQAYWQRAVASKPETAVKGYLIGGMAWLSIPLTLATTLGLSARALGLDLTPAQISAGLPAPQAAAALLGKGGAVAMLLLLFLAVTSATSAELVAVSSLVTHDIYQRYFLKGRATEKQLMRCSHLTVVLTSVIMGVLGLIFFYIGISMGWLYTLMGTLIGSGVVPVAIATSWKKANKWGCCVGAVGGLVVGLVAWLVTTAKLNDGAITITTTGQDYPLLAGNIGALVTGAVISIGWSLISPENFDFDITRAMNFAPIEDISETSTVNPVEREYSGDNKDMDEKAPTSSARVEPVEADAPVHKTLPGEIPELDYVGLNKALRLATWSSVILSLILLIIVPMPLFGTSYIWSEKGFVGWIVVTLAWSFAAGIAIILYPLWESRTALAGVFRGIGRDMRGKPPATQF